MKKKSRINFYQLPGKKTASVLFSKEFHVNLVLAIILEGCILHVVKKLRISNCNLKPSYRNVLLLSSDKEPEAVESLFFGLVMSLFKHC